MASLVSFLGSGVFFTPFIYIALYLYFEKRFSQHSSLQNRLKGFTVLFGLVMMIYGFTLSADLAVLLPSRGGDKVYLPASVFLVVVGIAMMMLPLFSKYIKFSNTGE